VRSDDNKRKDSLPMAQQEFTPSNDFRQRVTEPTTVNRDSNYYGRFSIEKRDSQPAEVSGKNFRKRNLQVKTSINSFP